MKKQHRVFEYRRIVIFRAIGNFLILFSLLLIVKTFYLPLKAELRYFIENRFNKQYLLFGEKPAVALSEKSNQPQGLLAKIFNVQTVEILVPEDSNFSIVIPKIGANARTLANIDASDEKIYLEALKKGVAQAAGTAYPGEGGHIFLFAHSTDYIWNIGTYNAVFYLLYKLEKNDEINIYYHGQRFVYKVIDKKTVDPDQVEYLTRKTNKESLTLQTCWPPGTTVQRLLVMATRVTE